MAAPALASALSRAVAGSSRAGPGAGTVQAARSVVSRSRADARNARCSGIGMAGDAVSVQGATKVADGVASYIRNTPNLAGSIGALSEADIPSPSTRRV